MSNLCQHLSFQGIFFFFFYIVFSKEVRKNLKNVFTGKKPLPDESNTTRTTLLTVNFYNTKQTDFIIFINQVPSTGLETMIRLTLKVVYTIY